MVRATVQATHYDEQDCVGEVARKGNKNGRRLDFVVDTMCVLYSSGNYAGTSE